MTLFRSSIGLSVALIVGAIAAHAPARAQIEKLPPEACRLLSEQLATLERGPAKALFDRGPEWAKANATPEQIAEVGRYIEVRERLKFRCPVGFDNLVVAAINGDIPATVPPTPERPSREILALRQALTPKRPRSRQAAGVPLPVRKPAQIRR